MLHTIQVRIVHYVFPPLGTKKIHKVYYFTPDLFTCRGVKNVDLHIIDLIENDIKAFVKEEPRFALAEFTITAIDPDQLVYLS